MIRVLIADNSPMLCKLTRAILESDLELRVVGEARNGEEAIALCGRLQPDIITMDIRMSQADGFQTIRHIMAESPRPIVVLTDTKSDSELASDFKALEAGALMVVSKPHDLPGTDPQANQLIAQVKAMAEVKVVRRRWWLLKDASAPQGDKLVPSTSSGQAPSTRLRQVQPSGSGQALKGATGPIPRLAPGSVRLIAIGASTGGPLALQVILMQLPSELPVPIVVVQHISHGFVGGLAHWLDYATPFQVKVAENGEPLRPGMVYLAPDDQHLLVTQDNLVQLKATPPVDGHRPSVTALFESVAQNYGPAAVGVLLTGMGSDGAWGLKALHDAGGYTIAQDEASSVVFGMPLRGIALGVVREVSPLEQIGARLSVLVPVRRRDDDGNTLKVISPYQRVPTPAGKAGIMGKHRDGNMVTRG